MADFTIKRGDTRPAIEITLKRGANPVGLASTAATPFTASLVKLIAKIDAPGPSAGFSGTMSQASAAGGVCRYTLLSGDSATAGMMNGEAQVTWSDGGIETFPEEGYFTINITQDLGD